ncbi:MAG: calcium:proton antiporter [Hyphomicrobiaceae bacterium]|nr:calcium:proton antiporter [Hyphomicrobiaceae bacterium]
MAVFRREIATLVAFATFAAFLFFGSRLEPDIIGFASSLALLTLLFLVMLWAAFRVVHHAECLGSLLGEPYGTLILTLSVIGIEVTLIAAIMITGADNPTLARDTMLSIIMIMLNGLVGLCLITGGIRHRLQEYNLEGAGAYLTMIIPFAFLGLVLPRFTQSAPVGELSGLMATFLVLMSVVLYGIFLAVQTLTHSDIFQYTPESDDDGVAADEHHDLALQSMSTHTIALIAALIPIVLLSKTLAVYVDYSIGTVGAPVALGGFLVAALILTPEALSAIRAARVNQLQRSVNICLGSALSTMSLTIPTVLLIGHILGKPVKLGLDPTEVVLLILTLAVSLVTFVSRRTHVLQGAVHLALFLAYVILIFDTG